MQAVSAHQQTAALKAAVELGLFTAVGAGHDTAEALSEHCQTSRKGMRVLCDFLTIHGFLAKQDGHYELTVEGDAYTFAEYDEMYRNSGFSRNEMHRLEGAPEAILLSRR